VIRVRFAPSPTGYLHIGGARTALFNWLYARRTGGTFVLRIEDTDVERSSEAMIDAVLDGLRWLGLTWDEGPGVEGPFGPYFQSQRLDRYRAVAEHLVTSGHAYYCYCTTDEIKAKREAAERHGGAWQYDRTCLALSPAEVRAREDRRQPRAIRARSHARAIQFDDQVHGLISFDGANIEDFVILRSDGHPTYHLSVVADDVDMQITHVVRGDDHISNTPKQLMLYEALGHAPPRFAHVPLILGPDKKRLSKRHGATSVMAYAERGYLPEAMVNFLALLGWSPGSGDRELYTREELIAVFDLSGISGGDAVFNIEKLDWFNQQHLWRLSADDLIERVRPFFDAAGLWLERYAGIDRAWFSAVLELLKPRVKRLDEFVELGRFFFVEAPDHDPVAVSSRLRVDGMVEHLEALDRAFGELPVFDESMTESTLRRVADERGIKAASLIHAVRVALTGRTASPGLFEVIVLLGRERTQARLAAARSLRGV